MRKLISRGDWRAVCVRLMLGCALLGVTGCGCGSSPAPGTVGAVESPGSPAASDLAGSPAATGATAGQATPGLPETTGAGQAGANPPAGGARIEVALVTPRPSAEPSTWASPGAEGGPQTPGAFVLPGASAAPVTTGTGASGTTTPAGGGEAGAAGGTPITTGAIADAMLAPAPEPIPSTPAEVGAALDRTLRAGVTALRAGRAEEAVARLRQAHRLEPADAGVLAFLRQAERAAAEGRVDGAEREAKETQRREERDALLGQFHDALRAKDLELAGRILASLRNSFPDDRIVRAARPALEKARQGRTDQVLYDRRVASWRNELARGAEAAAAGRVDQALAAYREALLLFPNDPLSTAKIRELEALRAAAAKTHSPAPSAAPLPSASRSPGPARLPSRSPSAAPSPSPRRPPATGRSPRPVPSPSAKAPASPGAKPSKKKKPAPPR